MAEADIFQLEEKYKDMTDENLINEAIKNQNNVALDCLMGRYKDIVNMKANKFFMVGSEKDDIVQEGYIKQQRHLTQKNKTHLKPLQQYV